MAESGSKDTAKAEPRLDALGIFWMVFTFAWTFMLAGGMYFLWRRRNMPLLRIRGLPLSFTAIILLHLYWGAVQTAYVWFPLATPQVEYWVMSTYLPFGIALFHASNSRFLHVAKTQKELFAASSHEKPRRSKSGPKGRFQTLDYTKKILVLVGLGMTFQLFLTIFMFLISRKFHPSFGIPGTEVTGTEDYQKSQMGRGWEWWPSVFWQFFWAWIVAPYILWNLHATPMWLIALYVPGMAPVNHVWVPPQWIALSIILLEIFTVFFPCYEVIQHQTLRQETLDSIAQWQLNKRVVDRGARSMVTGSATVADSALTSWSKDSKSSGSGESILTMEALEYVLKRDPEPLQQFSALRDFSGENIAFLRAVAEWKSSLPAAVRDPEKIKDASIQELVRERYNSALRIYTNFVSSYDAKFQINLSSQDLRKLEVVFESSARILYGEERQIDPATPFDSFQMTLTKTKSSAASAHGSETGIMQTESINNDSGSISDKALYWGDIPEGFNATIFDDAEGSIKYLVLTNTWPKFVKDRRCSTDSNDTLEAGNGIPAAR
ncbi:uncharacterized protein NECHADRAFT_98262 [Fusarium vanettenii 77-13-4]|uniref:RGS domain-containing protein n=1 Tax=Fusarium vanettenii (strain ATCC MYA-4622 / CBS 123669 / FGSC 9596 / NRRL 45880 / 77-13-4) TaxID=660122 RepID=C7ZPR7_FUSV7|nr:uncharacterized protein NECHADRAFT_98262 [Fusarium vanettenii 77-13-4]EEU33986.1 hypothetical protein NECHADRAFT_98262 [Fusarium vanettenii 77-13-4]